MQFSLADYYQASNDLESRYQNVKQGVMSKGNQSNIPFGSTLAPVTESSNSAVPLIPTSDNRGITLEDYNLESNFTSNGQVYSDRDLIGNPSPSWTGTLADYAMAAMLGLVDMGIPGLGTALNTGYNLARLGSEGNLNWNTGLKTVGKSAINYFNPGSRFVGKLGLDNQLINMGIAKGTNTLSKNFFSSIIDWAVGKPTPTSNTFNMIGDMEYDPALAVGPNHSPYTIGDPDQDPAIQNDPNMVTTGLGYSMSLADYMTGNNIYGTYGGLNTDGDWAAYVEDWTASNPGIPSIGDSDSFSGADYGYGEGAGSYNG